MTEQIDQTTGEITEAPAREPVRFDAAQHLTAIKGQEYLEVKWRLAWFRAEHPEGELETTLVSHDGDRAIFSALARIPGSGSATGWGSETASGFGNYIEKAETKAIGRALAALGFGTQFCQDFDDGPETGMLADAPVAPRSAPARPQTPRQQAAREQVRAGSAPSGDRIIAWALPFWAVVI